MIEKGFLGMFRQIGIFPNWYDLYISL